MVISQIQGRLSIQGESITIESVETWWREPVRGGDDPDVGVVVEARLIPCASIKISEGGSSTLQVSFRDGEDQLIGDILNLSVSNGKFENGSNETLVYATDGFTNPTMINPYVNQDITPWDPCHCRKRRRRRAHRQDPYRSEPQRK